MKIQGFVLLVALGGGASAHAQSIYGPGGLLLNPTADMPDKGQITPAILVIPQGREDGPGHLTWSSYSVDYGATKNLEVGGTYLKINPGGDRFQHGSAGLYAKYRLLSERPGRPISIAIGATALGGGDANASTAFAAARWTAFRVKSRPVHIHAGAMYIRELDGVRHNKAVPYIGIDYALSRRLTLFAEQRAKMGSGSSEDLPGYYLARSIGVAWQLHGRYKLVLAYARNGWEETPDHFSIGIGYSIGGGR